MIAIKTVKVNKVCNENLRTGLFRRWGWSASWEVGQVNVQGMITDREKCLWEGQKVGKPLVYP